MAVAALLLHSCGFCCYGADWAGQGGQIGHAASHLRQEPRRTPGASSVSARILNGYTPEAQADVVTSLPGYNASKHVELDFGLFAGYGTPTWPYLSLLRSPVDMLQIVHFRPYSYKHPIWRPNGLQSSVCHPLMQHVHSRRYITVDADAGRSLYYTFAESKTDASKHPLVLWLNGADWPLRFDRLGDRSPARNTS